MIEDDKLSQALIELWQPNSEVDTLEETAEIQHEKELQDKNRLIDEPAFLHVLGAKERKPSHIPVSTNLGLKYKRRMISSERTLEN